MASTTFTDNQTVIYAAWLNDVNNAVYNGVFQSTTLTATNMVCNGTASGAGFTALVNNVFSAPNPIGSVTPNTGAFTTLSATSASFSSALPIASGGTGLTSLGSSGYALSSNGSTLVYKKLGLGMTGEIWNFPTRAIGTTYTNSNTYPISVIVSLSRSGGSVVNMDGTMTVNGSIVNFAGIYIGVGTGGNWSISVSAIVPPGQTYVVTGNNYSTVTWAELY